ncbi:MAG: hypothetical protein PWQ92_59 [Thermococcaceae archaeon]|nr:hypothetical protein [Thermococcaceae archaeon]
MLIALVSDIHSNLEALKAVWREVKKADVIFCMGDLVGYGANPNEVVEFFRKEMEKREILCVRGIEFLRKLPVRQLFKTEKEDFLIIHGSPRAPLEEYLFPWLPDSEFVEVLKYFREKNLVVGHTHMQMLKDIQGRRIINPGGVGQPRDGDWRAAYALIDTESGEIIFERAEYDVDAAARKIVEAGLPKFLAYRLYEGY